MDKSNAPRSCNRPQRANDTLLELAGLDPVERVCLDIARFYFNTFALPGRHEWIMAIERAERSFGRQDGPVVAALMLKVIQAMRLSRRSCFSFSNPTCPCCARMLTEHERRLITAIASERRGRTKRAQLELMLLCEGNATAEIIPWLKDLTSALPAPARREALQNG